MDLLVGPDGNDQVARTGSCSGLLVAACRLLLLSYMWRSVETAPHYRAGPWDRSTAVPDSSQGCGVDAVSQFRADAKPPHVVGNNRGDALVALPRDACDVGRGENVLHPEKRMVRW